MKQAPILLRAWQQATR